MIDSPLYNGINGWPLEVERAIEYNPGREQVKQIGCRPNQSEAGQGGGGAAGRARLLSNSGGVGGAAAGWLAGAVWAGLGGGGGEWRRRQRRRALTHRRPTDRPMWSTGSRTPTIGAPLIPGHSAVCQAALMPQSSQKGSNARLQPFWWKIYVASGKVNPADVQYMRANRRQISTTRSPLLSTVARYGDGRRATARERAACRTAEQSTFRRLPLLPSRDRTDRQASSAADSSPVC